MAARPIRCCFCPHFASYIYWFERVGYRWPCCLTCVPKVGSQDGIMALDGSTVFPPTT